MQIWQDKKVKTIVSLNFLEIFDKSEKLKSIEFPSVPAVFSLPLSLSLELTILAKTIKKEWLIQFRNCASFFLLHYAKARRRLVSLSVCRFFQAKKTKEKWFVMMGSMSDCLRVRIIDSVTSWPARFQSWRRFRLKWRYTFKFTWIFLFREFSFAWRKSSILHWKFLARTD